MGSHPFLFHSQSFFSTPEPGVTDNNKKDLSKSKRKKLEQWVYSVVWYFIYASDMYLAWFSYCVGGKLIVLNVVTLKLFFRYSHVTHPIKSLGTVSIVFQSW